MSADRKAYGLFILTNIDNRALIDPNLSCFNIRILNTYIKKIVIEMQVNS